MEIDEAKEKVEEVKEEDLRRKDGEKNQELEKRLKKNSGGAAEKGGSRHKGRRKVCRRKVKK